VNVLIVRRGDWSTVDAIRRTENILGYLTETKIAQSILLIERDRAPRRRLPIGR